MVIETAVRKGINSSVIGEFLEKKYGIKDERNTIKDDLDNHKIKKLVSYTKIEELNDKLALATQIKEHFFHSY